ncbi:MAG: fused DSP-PTPase phosphatase/NAD kinase-like protein, partial [Betaproteobacteria bacterium]
MTREVPAPVILCIDDNPAGGGQPSSEAYAKAAMNGFRSVLTLRSPKDGVDLTRERLVVERNKLRYFNIPYRADFPQREQVDEFLKLARDPLNQPMLVNCAFAERVAPLMMMFHILEQGWPEDRAVEEASRSGLATTKLRQFAKDY